MNITVAKSAGFCFGVKRAVNKVYEQADIKDGPIYTYGPIIHNEEVVKDLKEKGVTVLDDLETLTEEQRKKGGTVIIRSHGVSKEIYQRLEQAGFEIEDATCPFVLKIHQIVEEFSNDGYEIVIIGSARHPEVEGIRGWCDPEFTTVIADQEEAENFEPKSGKKVCIVAQTTFNYKKFQELVEIIQKKGYIRDIRVLNTICNATEERQNEAASLAETSDIMIVIGGRSSSNTQKLYEICKEECANTYYIQTAADLHLSETGHIDNVGITAGASTPKKIIEEVQKYVRTKL
uniref:4-hydroxy-3-methylbut-2-enyl diphosphate reductase n=1 Tax=Eubacterium plexicaudatum ASF492 TaxID=1235802 RepID=N2BC78_9FIRM